MNFDELHRRYPRLALFLLLKILMRIVRGTTAFSFTWFLLKSPRMSWKLNFWQVCFLIPSWISSYLRRYLVPPKIISYTHLPLCGDFCLFQAQNWS